jgi:competence protein ComEA
MPSAEQRALLLLLALAVAGQGVRHFATRPGEPPGQVQLLQTLAPGSPRAQRDSAMRQARPLDSGERVDLDRAPVAELTRLPKIGPRLAKIIVADRAAHGPFGGLPGLDRVAGVGPGLLKVIAPHVVFSGASGQVATSGRDVACGGESTVRQGGCQPASLNINSASVQDLDGLPGVGPAKAAAILQYREQHGPFPTVDDLARVPGFGPAAVSRLRDRLAAP